jgi:hypothetical protein
MCPYCSLSPHSKWCTRFGMQDPTVSLTGLKPLDIAFKKLDNELLRRPLKTYSLLLDTFKELK